MLWGQRRRQKFIPVLRFSLWQVIVTAKTKENKFFPINIIFIRTIIQSPNHLYGYFDAIFTEDVHQWTIRSLNDSIFIDV